MKRDTSSCSILSKDWQLFIQIQIVSESKPSFELRDSLSPQLCAMTSSEKGEKEILHFQPLLGGNARLLKKVKRKREMPPKGLT